MKKLSILVLSLLAVMMFSACDSKDDPVNKQTVSSDIYNRAVHDDNVVFSQYDITAELNYTDMTIQLSSAYKDIDGQKRTLTTPAMKLTLINSYYYSFDAGMASTSDLEGFIDLTSGVMWYTFTTNSGTQVYSTTQLQYYYTTTTITNPDNGNHSSHNNSGYMFIIDSSGNKCVFVINNFIPNINGNIQAEQVYYEGVTITPTATGYTVTADSLESSYKGYFGITNLKFTLDDQGRVANGSFTSGDLEFRVNANLFPHTN